MTNEYELSSPLCGFHHFPVTRQKYRMLSILVTGKAWNDHHHQQQPSQIALCLLTRQSNDRLRTGARVTLAIYLDRYDRGEKRNSLCPVRLRLSRRRHNVTRTTEQHSPSGWIESARLWPVCSTVYQTVAHQCGWHYTKNRLVEQATASFLFHQTGLYMEERQAVC